MLDKAIGDASIGMDCSIVPTRFAGYFQVSTTDFFFPLVQDPYLQGKIACANVLSDLFALGLVHCDNMLMLLGACSEMPATEREIVVLHMIKGFNELAKEAGTRVTGGQTTVNPWPLIGGVAMCTAQEEDLIRPENAQAGDVIVLTKPLGTQVAVNVHEWMVKASPLWQSKVLECISEEDALRAYDLASESMSRLNKTGAVLMHKHKAHGATDVTGFGILGHANNLAHHQIAPVDLVLEVLPIIKGMKQVDEKMNGLFSLLKGFSAETSGGLLVCLPSREAAEAFCREIEEIDGKPAWIVGRVVEGERKARIIDEPTIFEI